MSSPSETPRARGAHDPWPPLPLDAAWSATRDTLHMWSQIVGKTVLASAPPSNHWWHVALRIASRGLVTPPLPHGDRLFEVAFDFFSHQLHVTANDGATRSLPLGPQTVAEFYQAYRQALRELDLDVPMWPHPVEVAPAIPFADDREHRTYDPASVERFWQIILQTDRVFQEFRGRFLGKASPIHFFWGGFDLAYTRFSGRTAPLHPGGVPHVGNWVMHEAYSHEVSSAGFWPGNEASGGAAFYAYAYPEPEGYSTYAVRPSEAFYHPEMREFLLPYDRMREAAHPDDLLIDFLQTTYEAAADRARWDRAALDRATPLATPPPRSTSTTRAASSPDRA